MLNALWIFVGGGLGHLARWRLSGSVAQRLGWFLPSDAVRINASDPESS